MAGDDGKQSWGTGNRRYPNIEELHVNWTEIKRAKAILNIWRVEAA